MMMVMMILVHKFKDLGLRGLGLQGFRVQGCRVWGLELRVQGLELGVQVQIHGLRELRVQGLGRNDHDNFRVKVLSFDDDVDDGGEYDYQCLFLAFFGREGLRFRITVQSLSGLSGLGDRLWELRDFSFSLRRPAWFRAYAMGLSRGSLFRDPLCH